MKKSFLLIALILLASVPVFAAVAVDEDSTYVGEASKIDFTGDLNVSFDGSTATVDFDDFSVEVNSSTADTVTSADDKTIFISTATADATFTLPTAASGLDFIFCDGGGGKYIYIDPASTLDTIKYLHLDGGDKVKSSGATGDSIRLIGATSTWYVVDTGSSAWTDGGI